MTTLAATVALAAVATAPAEAAVVPGARYDAVGGKPRQRQFATISADGKRVVRYAVAANGKCTDGKAYEVTFNDVGEPKTFVKADGSFANPPTPVKVDLTRRATKKTYSGRIASGMAGTSTPDGNRLVVQVTATFTSKKLRCQAKGAATLVRAGTPGAPVASPRLFNGRYAGTSARNLRISSFSMLAAAGEFSNLKVSYRLPCAHNRYVPRTFTFKPQVLLIADRFSSAGEVSARVKGTRNSRSTLRDRFSISFVRLPGGDYGYRGTYRAVIEFRRGGRLYDRCALRPTSFGQQFRPPAS